MMEQIGQIFSNISASQINVLCLLGLALFGGTMGARLFQIIRVPQVVGYIVIGIVIGLSGFRLIDERLLGMLEPLNFFALGLIGFMIGGELKGDVLRKYGKQFVSILLFEGVAAFLIVFALVGTVGSLFLPDSKTAWCLALLLGAIASATAPAATTDVLWEYKTRGPLTTTVFGIVAMDDGLALFLFAIASAVVSAVMGGVSQFNLTDAFIYPLHQILGAIIIGVGSGGALIKLLKRYTEREKILALSLGTVLLAIGLSLTLKVDMLLASMTLGAVIVNGTPRQSKEIFQIVHGFTPPIYVLFFVLVGAKLNLHSLTLSMLILVVLYMAGRTLGKMAGSWVGATVSGAPLTVRKYLPWCLFSQAGVAIGLSIVASHAFAGDIGNTIVVVITATTFIAQLIGPSCTKYAVTKAGEVGLNITEDDLLKKTRVSDIMDKEPPIIFKTTPLMVILKTFSDYNYLNYPVVDENQRLAGIITLENLRQTFMETDTSDLFLAYDLMEPAKASIHPEALASELKELLNTQGLDYMPVVAEDQRLAGFVDERLFEKEIATRIIQLQKQAESLG